MQDKDILTKITQKFGETGFSWVDDHTGDPYLMIPVERLRQLAAFLKEEPALGFNALSSISGVHQMEEIEKIEVVYHLFSYRHRHRLTLKVQLERPLILFHYYLRVDTGRLAGKRGLRHAGCLFQRTPRLSTVAASDRLARVSAVKRLPGIRCLSRHYDFSRRALACGSAGRQTTDCRHILKVYPLFKCPQ